MYPSRRFLPKQEQPHIFLKRSNTLKTSSHFVRVPTATGTDLSPLTRTLQLDPWAFSRGSITAAKLCLRQPQARLVIGKAMQYSQGRHNGRWDRTQRGTAPFSSCYRLCSKARNNWLIQLFPVSIQPHMTFSSHLLYSSFCYTSPESVSRSSTLLSIYRSRAIQSQSLKPTAKVLCSCICAKLLHLPNYETATYFVPSHKFICIIAKTRPSSDIPNPTFIFAPHISSYYYDLP